MQRTDERGEPGFTLTELLVVIAIIMVLAAAAVPALNAFRRGQKLSQAARIVQSALNDVRRRAITQHARHVVVLYSFEDPTEELFKVKHAIAVYSEPVGQKGKKGYFPGGYVGNPLILPPGVRFAQDKMQLQVFPAQGDSAKPIPEDSEHFRRRNPEALTFRADGTIQDFNDYPGVHPSVGVNIYLEEEGYYQVPEETRADIVLVETGPAGDEIKSDGKSQRVLIDLMPMVGRSNARAFDVGQSFETDRVVGN